MLPAWFQHYGGIRGYFSRGIRAEIWHLVFVLLIMPLQVFVSYELARVMDPHWSPEDRFPGRIFPDHCSTLISLELWRQLYLQRVKFGMIEESPSTLYPESTDPRGECPAVEVMKYRFPEGYYAQSYIPRYERHGLRHHVGDIVQHLTHGYRGVIVGWDLTAKAPQEWFKSLYDSNELPAAYSKNEPHFAVLVDIRDLSPPQMIYLPQHLLVRYRFPSSPDHRGASYIVHPVMRKYFVSFDGSSYVPRPWLRVLYPEDLSSSEMRARN